MSIFEYPRKALDKGKRKLFSKNSGRKKIDLEKPWAEEFKINFSSRPLL
jgi:hypothetical protein